MSSETDSSAPLEGTREESNSFRNEEADCSSRDKNVLKNQQKEADKRKKTFIFPLIVLLSSILVIILVVLAVSFLIVELKTKTSVAPVAFALTGFIASITTVIAITSFLAPTKDSKESSLGTYGSIIRSILSLLPMGGVIEVIADSKVLNSYQKNSFDDELLSLDDKKEIVEKIRSGLESELVLEANNILMKKVASSSKQLKIDDFYKTSRDRLITETESQSKRGALNLGIGIVTAIIGVVFLIYTLFTSTEQTDFAIFITHFAPRASIVVLIEVFAYFFLRLYKSSLDEIKYFQNELTNLESKYLAVLLLDGDKESPVFSSTVNSLIDTERNFILEKGQSTILLERDKIASSTEARVFSLFEKVLPKK